MIVVVRPLYYLSRFHAIGIGRPVFLSVSTARSYEKRENSMTGYGDFRDGCDWIIRICSFHNSIVVTVDEFRAFRSQIDTELHTARRKRTRRFRSQQPGFMATHHAVILSRKGRVSHESWAKKIPIQPRTAKVSAREHSWAERHKVARPRAGHARGTVLPSDAKLLWSLARICKPIRLPQ